MCAHPERWRIELAKASGVPLDTLAAKHDLDRTAIHRHWHAHVEAKAKAGYLAGPTDLADLQAKAVEEGDSVLDYLRIVRTQLMAAMATATELGDHRGTAVVASALLSCLEKLGKVTGEIAQLAQGSTTINLAIVQSPEFARIQQVQLAALAPFPEARAAVIGAWRALDAEAAGLVSTRPAPLQIEAVVS